ncbi:ATP-binding cassette domain-containing protein [Novosphingobium sp. ERN07]|uniref:ATP-binding cassette domain-containing protein n=1 Tax=Novosphingobium sp. ERN07 TaxID=2726187 RepID=UPI001456DA78|nr:ATP-binding cassette domain-containing protein [Novosphingobium sp. ERN07]NLR72164.1 ATP-binding cassette domain-containing protein [Novosphingobium sp. ERN07]
MTQDLLAIARRSQRRTSLTASLAGMIAAVTGVALVAISGWFLTGAALAGAGGIVAVQAFNYLLPSAGIRGLAITRTVSRYFERLLGHRAALLALADLRPQIFSRLASADIDEISSRSGGTIAAHLGSDIEALEDLAIRRVAMTAAAAGGLAGLGSALLAGLSTALVLVLGLGLTLLGTRVLAPRLLAKPYRDHGEALQSLKRLYSEYASCSVDLALYGQAGRVSAILEAQGLRLDHARLAIVRGEGLLQGLQLALASLTIAGMLASMHAPLAIQALAALAGAGAFEALGSLNHSLLQRSRVEAALGRLTVIATLPARTNIEKLSPFGGRKPSVTLGNDHGAITVEAGERIRIAGVSGSGKSRLVMSLVGLRRDAPETILVDGTKATELSIEALREVFAFSGQDAPLIAGTIADNLRLAKPGVTEPGMWLALEVACLAETVRDMPDELETWLGAEGARLSGGQRKRLSLARALLAEKSWLVLDEPSEGLDLATEQQLACKLDAWLRETGTGLVLVNHRPGLDWLAKDVLEL